MTDYIDPRDEEFHEQMMDAFKALVEASDEEQGDIKFDLFARPLHAFEWVQEYVPGLIVYSAGGLVPFQAEGLINGYPFYYRSEWGSCSIKIGRLDDLVPYVPEESYWYAYDDEFEGVTVESFVEALTRLLPKVKRQQNFYEFEVFATNFVGENGSWVWEINPDEITTVVGWGYTAEEAFIYASQPDKYLESKGFTVENQREHWFAQKPNPVPVYVTQREWPDVEPVFEVKPFTSSF